jgi:hypothetical protein
VHGENVALRQNVVEDRKDSLFDFACVVRSADQDKFAGEIQNDECVAARAVDFWIRMQIGGVNDGPVRLESGQILVPWSQEEAVGEQGMPGLFGNDANSQPIRRIRSRPAIDDEQLPALQIGRQTRVNSVADGRVHLAIDFTPGDLAFARRLRDDKSIFRRPPGMPAGIGNKCAFVAKEPFQTARCQFAESGRR